MKKEQNKLVSNGCYSVMNDEWIKEPVKEDIPEIDKEAFDKEFKVWEDRYNKIVDNSEEKLEEALHENTLNEVLRSINKMEIIVSILNYVTGNDYSYLLEKERLIGGTRLVPKYILHHADYNHENNVLDNLYILNRNDHQKYHHGLISWDEIEKINISNILNEFLKDKSSDVVESIKTSILAEDINTAKSIITDQIRGEWEAISNYDKAVSELENLDGDFQNAIDILNDIADEEEVHVGEEQKVLSELDNNVLNNIKEGEEEAEEKISEPAKDLNFDESLNEEIHTKQLDEIESFISDIYALRQKGLQESGEYGIENLVFKEIRNKGYLDNLKDLKNQLVSKELSLESLNLDESITKYKNYFIDYIPGYGPYSIQIDGDDVMFETLDDAKKYIDELENKNNSETLEEGTVKNSKGKWVNKGEDGTHGEFKTKKAADAQRKAMFASGWKHEELEEGISREAMIGALEDWGKHYYFNKYTDAQIYNIYIKELRKQEEQKWQDRIKKQQEKDLPKEKFCSDCGTKLNPLGECPKCDLDETDLKEARRAIDNDDFVFTGFDDVTSNADIDYDSYDSVYYDIIDNKRNNLNLFKQRLNNNVEYRVLVLNPNAYKDKEKIYSFKDKRSAIKFYNAVAKDLKEREKTDVTVKFEGNKYNNYVDNLPVYKRNYTPVLMIRESLEINDFIKQWAEADFEVGKTFDPDDFNEFRKIAKEDGYDVTEKDFNYYFDCLCDCRENSNIFNEMLNDKQRIEYRNELSRISYSQPIIQDNGLFNIYNIKENDIDRIVRRIRELDYIEWVQKNESGKYDFSKVVMFGQPQSKYYNITGKIKEKSLDEGKIITQYVHYDKDGLVDAIADTAIELANLLGVKPNTISQELRRGSKAYAKVKFDEDDEFEDLILPEEK